MVRRGLEALQGELHHIGLTLNDAKTAILRRETFADHVAQIAGAEYEDADDIGDAPATPSLLAGTTAMLRKALRAQKTKKSRLQEAQAIDEVRRALRRLTRWADPGAVRHGQAIINRHPSLTQHYGRYCARLVDGHGEDIAQYLNEVFPKLILTPWQEMWLLEPFIAGAPPEGPRLKRWLTRTVEDGRAPSILRARAALAAAEGGLIETAAAARLIDVMPEVARPDAIAAYAIAAGGDDDAGENLAGLPDSLLASWIFESAV